MQSVLHVLRCCSTSHLSPLISSPAALVSTSLFFNPPLFFSSHSVFFSSSRILPPPSNLATLSSHPSVLLCCFLPAHYPSPPLRCPPCVLLNTFPAFLLHFLFICFPFVTVVITFSLLSVYFVSLLLAANFLDPIPLFSHPYTPPSTSPLHYFHLCLHCFNSIFFVILSLSFNLSSISRRYASICPITASLTLCLPLLLSCLWPSALCTSNGWGVIHWLICWQPVWQGISFVSLPSTLPLSVCVREREGEGRKKRGEGACDYLCVCVCAYELCCRTLYRYTHSRAFSSGSNILCVCHQHQLFVKEQNWYCGASILHDLSPLSSFLFCSICQPLPFFLPLCWELPF